MKRREWKTDFPVDVDMLEERGGCSTIVVGATLARTSDTALGVAMCRAVLEGGW